jgi:hypothetical protein
MSTTPEARDTLIDQAQQERMTRDTLILQKVNGAHREAFIQKFPGQCEHILRLIAERLQAVMTNKPPALSEALYYVYQVHKEQK